MNYQTIVLSGGGAKGPYALGVLLALEKFHNEHNKDITKIYCGTSVGALNATIAAQGDLSELTKLYSDLRTEHILGVKESSVKKLSLWWRGGRKPFHYFDNRALKSTITKFAKFDKLANSHLLICATNYTTGVLETFYISSLVDAFLDHEKTLPEGKRRLTEYHRITTQEQLIQVLMATTAIPFYLPPVEIGKFKYVDGGVGNNTPLRQAVYVSRFLSCRQGADKPTSPVETLCVINDPIRFSIKPGEFNDVFGVIRRTMDIYHNVLVCDLDLAWDRINRELAEAKERENRLISQIEGLDGIPQDKKLELVTYVRELMGATSASTPRCSLPLIVIRPTTPLLSDILQFDPLASEELRRRGIADCLSELRARDRISPPDERRWTDQIE